MDIEEMKQKGLDHINKSIEEFTNLRYFSESSIDTAMTTLKGKIRMMVVLGLINRHESFRIKERVRDIANTKKVELNQQIA